MNTDLDKESEKKIQRSKEEANQMLKMLRGFEVRSQRDLDTLDEVIDHARSQWKDLEALRKSITRPIDQAKKAVQGLFKPAQTSLKEIETLAKDKISEHAREEEEKNRRAMESGDTSAVTNVADTQGVTLRKRWVYEIQDPDNVPRALCSPDMAKIKELAAQQREQGQEPSIPGVRIYVEDQAVSKAKRAQ